MSNQISFTSNIKFINKSQFIDLINRPISKYGLSKEINHMEYDMRFANDFFSPNVRSCTGGGLINTKKNQEPFGFHIFNNKHNNDSVENTLNYVFDGFEPDRALIVGSKKGDFSCLQYSSEIFEKIKKYISARVKNVTIFETHKPKLAQTSFHYCADEDTWHLLSQFDTVANAKEVSSLDDLLKMFKEIKIAKGDKLFIGEKEILPQDCPDIFTT